jgi:hypothetical protein
MVFEKIVRQRVGADLRVGPRSLGTAASGPHTQVCPYAVGLLHLILKQHERSYRWRACRPCPSREERLGRKGDLSSIDKAGLAVKNRHFGEKIPACADDLRVSAASGSERGSIDRPIDGASLATARGTDPAAVLNGTPLATARGADPSGPTFRVTSFPGKSRTTGTAV